MDAALLTGDILVLLVVSYMDAQGSRGRTTKVKGTSFHNHAFRVTYRTDRIVMHSN
jgi:hypothetical protein